jgi:hypothetical protein
MMLMIDSIHDKPQHVDSMSVGIECMYHKLKTTIEVFSVCAQFYLCVKASERTFVSV